MQCCVAVVIRRSRRQALLLVVEKNRTEQDRQSATSSPSTRGDKIENYIADDEGQMSDSSMRQTLLSVTHLITSL